MSPGATRTTFHRSRLVRTLAGFGAVESAAPGAGFAEKLGHWIDVAGAIQLRTALSVPPAGRTPYDGPPRHLAQALADDLARLRTALETALAQSRHPSARGRLAMPRPKPGTSPEVANAFEPYRRYYQAQQREMDLKIPPLRVRVREALQGTTPALAQLAALDAALGGVLATREGPLLETLATLLERRFQQLHQTHREQMDGAPQADTPEAWMHAGGWLHRFCDELQELLQAELDLRLQPIEGLVEALYTEMNSTR